MNLLSEPDTFDIYRQTDKETGLVSYISVPAGQSPFPNDRVVVKQMTVGTPHNAISEVISSLEAARNRHSQEV